MPVNVIRNLFGLAPGEASKVFAFALLGGLLQAGLSVGMSTGDSMFLVHVGATQLPIVYLLTPVVMLVYIPIFSFLLTRIGIDRLFALTLVLLVLCGVGLPFGIRFAEEAGRADIVTILFYATKLYTVLWYIALYTLYWNFVDGYFDILDAKRLFSLLAAGSAFGAAVGGGLVSYLTEFFDVQQLFFVWSVFALLSMPVLYAVRRGWKKIEHDEQETTVSIAQQLQQLMSAFRGSRFAVLLATTLFLTMSLTLLCEFQYYDVLSKNRSEAELASLFGRLFFAVNIFNFCVNLFLFNRLVSWFGVRNMALIQPLSYLATFTIFLLRNDVLAGVAGFFAFHGLLTSIDYNNTNFLLNALPTEAKKQLRTFIEGICEPMANAFMGLLMLFVVKKLTPEQLSEGGMIFAAVCFLFVLAQRSAYVSAMVVNLKKGWLDFSRPASQLVAQLPEHEIERLRERIKLFNPSEQSGREQLTAIRLLMHRDRETALDALLRFFGQAAETDLDEAEELLSELLRSQDHELVQRVLLWLEEERTPMRPTLIAELAPWGLIPVRTGLAWLTSSNKEEQAAGSVVVHSGHKIESLAASLETVRKLLSDDEAAQRAAIDAIGCMQTERYAHVLTMFLGSPSEEIRLAALAALKKLVTPNSTRLVAPLLKVLDSNGERQRLLAMDCLGSISDSGSLSSLLSRSHLFSPAERRRAERIITSAGLKAVPVCVTVLSDTHYHLSARSIAGRALAKLSFAQLEALSPGLIETELQRVYERMASRHALAAEPQESAGARVLIRTFRDRERAGIDFVLELLTLSGRVASYELLSASLRSPNQKERANAVETLQQACGRRVFRSIAPLLDRRRNDERKKTIAALNRRAAFQVDAILLRSLSSVDAAESAAAAQALWDRRREDAAEPLRAVLRSDSASLRAKVIMSLLSRHCWGMDAVEPFPNVIERLDTLCACRFFNSFGIDELLHIADVSEMKQFGVDGKIFSAGEEADSLFVIRAGHVALEANGTVRTLASNDVLGNEAVLGEMKRSSDARSSGSTVICISREQVLDRAKLNARIAKGLLAHKLGAAA